VAAKGGMDQVGSQPHAISEAESSHQHSPVSGSQIPSHWPPESLKTRFPIIIQ